MDREEGVIEVFTDGGSRGNPGPSACAFVVFINNTIFHQGSKYLGIATNNEAEYQGLIMALNFLSEFDLSPYKEIDIKMDSELVVKQLTGMYKIKNPKLKFLYDKVVNLINAIGIKINFKHIPRSENYIADGLVNSRLNDTF